MIEIVHLHDALRNSMANMTREMCEVAKLMNGDVTLDEQIILDKLVVCTVSVYAKFQL